MPVANEKNIKAWLGKYLQENYATPEGVKRLAALVKDPGLLGREGRYADRVDRVLEAANTMLNGHGIEPINGDYHVSNFYMDIVALYVNMGDTYIPTLLYETDTQKFLVTSWGDWVERNQKKYRIR